MKIVALHKIADHYRYDCPHCKYRGWSKEAPTVCENCKGVIDPTDEWQAELIEGCPCGGEYELKRYCGAHVCDTCGNHKGLERCFCGWSKTYPGEGRRELEEMGEAIEPEASSNKKIVQKAIGTCVTDTETLENNIPSNDGKLERALLKKLDEMADAGESIPKGYEDKTKEPKPRKRASLEGSVGGNTLNTAPCWAENDPAHNQAQIELWKQIQHGDEVTILSPRGQELKGKAVMKNRNEALQIWVLNMGGRHGTPGLASPKNLVSVRRPRVRSKTPKPTTPVIPSIPPTPNRQASLTVEAIKRHKKRPKSHVGKLEGAFNPPNWSRKMDSRLTPVHRYVLQTDFPIIIKRSKVGRETPKTAET